MYEQFTREPNLETALALEAIFQRPASELFGGLYQKVQTKVAARAKILANRIGERQTAQRRQVLINIANNSLN